MIRLSETMFAVIFGMLMFMLNSKGVAQTRSQMYGNTLEKQTHTIQLRADSGLATYESEAAGSNATGSMNSFSIANYAGEFRSFGTQFTRTRSSIGFALNDSKIVSTDSEVMMSYRFFFVYPSITLSMQEINIAKDAAEFAAIVASNIGVGLRFEAPLTEKIIVSGEAMNFQNYEAHDKGGRDVGIGPKQVIDVFASVDVVEAWIDILVGYKISEFAVEVGDQSYQEKISAPYAGIRTGLYF